MKKKTKEQPRKSRNFSADGFYRFIIFFLAYVIIISLFAYDQRGNEWRFDVKVGEPAPKDVFAPFSFTFLDEAKTKEAKNSAASMVLPVYRIDTKVNNEILTNLEAFIVDVSQTRQEAKIDISSEIVKDVVSESNVKELNSLKEKELETYTYTVKSTVIEMLSRGLISFSKKVELLDENKRIISLLRPEGEVEVNVFDLTSVNEARDNVFKIALEEFPRNRRRRNVFIEMVNSFIKVNLVYDSAITEMRKKNAYDEMPEVEVSVKKNENILRRGSIIFYTQLLKLKEIENQITKKKVAAGIVSLGLVVLLCMIILACYLHFFEYRLFHSLRDVMLINVTIVFNVLINKALMINYTLFDFLQVDVNYLLPTSFAALLLAVLIKPRIGFCVAVVATLLNGVMTDYDQLVMITTLCASIIGTYAVIDIRRREQFFIVGLLVGLVHCVLNFSFSIVQEMTFMEALKNAPAGIFNGIFIVVLLFFFLYFFEKMFDITTSISLLEVNDLNHALLKRLSIEAPGTYHHSLVVSNLAESAAEAINANSLLARVGAYFHDIGKIEKAEYFTENQTSKNNNIHDNLTPRMSYFIITNHVKDGIELARKHKLKKLIVDFIVQHHGTSIVYYFYKKAIDGTNENEDINVSDFRYSGPKPQSKEIAITLLADSVEAASRTLSEPTPASLRGLVDKVVNDKFLDNQLDGCELTLVDLHKIKESFVRNLMAIFHTRVEYPEKINESIQGKRVNS